MSPAERALVLAVLAGIATLRLEPDLEPQSGGVASVILWPCIGLISGTAIWTRGLSGGSLLVSSKLFTMAVQRSNQLELCELAMNTLLTASIAMALPFLDPPTWLRNRTKAHKWLWPFYYLSSAVTTVAAIGVLVYVVNSIRK
jgi:hypothetical protein